MGRRYRWMATAQWTQNIKHTRTQSTWRESCRRPRRRQQRIQSSSGPGQQRRFRATNCCYYTNIIRKGRRMLSLKVDLETELTKSHKTLTFIFTFSLLSFFHRIQLPISFISVWSIEFGSRWEISSFVRLHHQPWKWVFLNDISKGNFPKDLQYSHLQSTVENRSWDGIIEKIHLIDGHWTHSPLFYYIVISRR